MNIHCKETGKQPNQAGGKFYSDRCGSYKHHTYMMQGLSAKKPLQLYICIANVYSEQFQSKT